VLIFFTAPQGLKLRDRNAPASFNETDTPKSPVAATGPLSAQTSQGSDVIRTAPHVGKSRIIVLKLRTILFYLLYVTT